MRKIVFLADIDLENSPTVRAEVRPDVVEDYAELYGKRGTMPPPHVFQSKGDKFWLLADGRHRVEGARVAGRKALECETHTGGYQDALKFAVGANIAHGLRRSNADKRRSVVEFLKEFPTISNVQCSTMCVVGETLVREVRTAMEGDGQTTKQELRIDAHGVTRKNPTPKKKNVGATATSDDSSSLKARMTMEPQQVTKAPSVVVDATGYPVPEGCMVWWNRSQEVQDILTLLTRIKSFLEDKKEAGDKMYWEIGNGTIADLEKVRYSISAAKPYAVCTSCQGHPELQPNGNCRHCGGRGVFSKFRWDTVPRQIREIREKTVKAGLK